MSKFLDWVSNHVRAHIASELHTSGDGNFRSVFAGLPENMLDDLLEGLVNDGFMQVSINGNDEKVIVLLPTKTEKNPDGISSGRCNQGYLVSVRNSHVKHLLTLQPPGETQIKSIRSTVTWFGVSPAALADASVWCEDTFVREILRHATRSRGIANDEVPSWLSAVMLRLAVLDEVNGFTDTKWTVMRRLFDQPAPNVENGNFLVMFAACGLVRPSDGEGDLEALPKLVETIGEYLEREGLVNGFASLRHCAQQLSGDDYDVETIIDALNEFEKHVLKCAKSAPGFASFALRFYCPYEECHFDGSIPDWWYNLDTNTWQSLLDCKPAPQSCIKVKVVNGIGQEDLKGLPAVTNNGIRFEITVTSGASRPRIEVTRRVGRRNAETIGTIDPGFGNSSFHDEEVPSHNLPLTYTFEPSDPGCKPASTRVISLQAYEPGFVASSRGAEKVTLPKLAKSSGNTRVYECDLELDGQGVHQMDLLACTGFQIDGVVHGYGVTTDDDDEDETIVNPAKITEGQWNFYAETDEECRYEFNYTLLNGESARARLSLRAGDVEPAGTSSEFHRLVLEVSSGRSARVTLKESQLIYSLERWMLDDKLSYRPLLLSPSLGNSREKPDWDANPLWSSHTPVYDPRPDASVLTPPDSLVKTRHKIAQMIREEQKTGICERAPMGKLYMHDEKFHARVDQYVTNYIEWLKDDYENAALFDTVLACFYQPRSEVLQPVPVAVLLSPLHPLRLGWQVAAQYLLVDAQDRGVKCPGASVIDSSCVPDSMALPVVNAKGDTGFVPFVSIPSSSDYWGVLWNSNELDKLGSSESNRLFSEDLGITISGLSAGFSGAQVKRAMQEVFDVSAGRSRLRVRLLSDVEGKTDTHEGINDWALAHLGNKDPWQVAARTSIDVIDARRDEQRPIEPFVANLTTRTQGAVRWIVDNKDDAQHVDLSLISHLKRITPETCTMSAHSSTSLGSLTRERTCYPLAATGGHMLGESRTLPSNLTPATLSKKVDSLALNLELIDSCFESAMASKCSCDGISFAPNLPILERGLEASAYCAVSSTDVDSSAFLRTQHGPYLWDYDIPSYAGKAQENAGYYLLAKHSTEIEKQVERALTLLGGVNFENEITRQLLAEISQRGLPSLKELASGGSSATGELGLLVACRLLQGPPGCESDIPKLLPLIDEERRVINLLLPVDPFAAQFDDLRKALKTDNFQRPDLLVASMRFDEENNPVALHLTPIEVKARTGNMNVSARRSALAQASSFALFLTRLLIKAKEEPVWMLAVTKFMATWFSFCFRVHAGMVPSGFRDQFMECNSAVNQALLRGQLESSVDKRGRLVVIHDEATSHPSDLDGDGFEETISLKPGDALGVITSPASSSVLRGIIEQMGTWDLPVPTTRRTDVATGWVGPRDTLREPDNHGQPVTDPPGIREPDKIVRPPIDKPVENLVPATQEAATGSGEEMLKGSTGIRFDVGKTLDSFHEESREFFPGNTQLTQLNIGVVGNLGTGKTQLTKALIYQLSRKNHQNFEQKPFFLIFDYKRDYSDSEFVQTLGAKVIKPRNIPINIFDTSTVPGESPPWLERSNFLCDVLAKIYAGIGPVQRENLKQSVKNAYRVVSSNSKTAPTLPDVFAEYRQLVNKPDAVFSILSDMVDMELFEENPKHLLPFSRYLEGVVVVDLASLGQNDKAKSMLVVLFLNLFYENMLRLKKFPFVGKDPQLRTINGFLLVDEADNIMRYQFPVLQNVLLQSREFGVGVLLASQYLSHFRPDAHTNYREPLLTWFIHQVPTVTVNELKGIGLAEVDNGTVSRIQELGQHECLYKSLGINGEFIRGTPYYVLKDGEQDNTN